jgi:uncharacterized protein YprB with RNaseH-like and TPR domain
VTDTAKSERLAQLRALIGEVSARDARLKERVKTREAAQPEAPLWPRMPTPLGELHVHERYLEPDHHHGSAPVRSGLCGDQRTLATLLRDALLPDVDLSRALYLDTETTGLAGGTGTVAFLVGLARFEQGALCTEQLIVPQLGAEAPVLGRLAERIAAASCIVTYNGKSFDWPLLRTRFVLARMPVPALPLHIDLLHMCRSVWKARLPSVRLVDMEREVLRFEREDDIPGAEIPARYFEYLRTGSPSKLVAVLEHNQNDLIAMAALLGALMAQFAQVAPLLDARDAISYGRVALRARDCERARAFAQVAIALNLAGDDRARALILAADVERHLGEMTQAVALLERALAHSLHEPRRWQLHMTLTKLYEHEHGDLEGALRHARQTEPIEGPMLHGRRLGRLHRRLMRRQDLTHATATPTRLDAP